MASLGGAGRGFTVGFGVGIVFDRNGHVASYGYAQFGGSSSQTSVNGGVQVTVSDAVNVWDLCGPFHNFSFSKGIGITHTGEYFYGNSEDGPVHGVSYTYGTGYNVGGGGGGSSGSATTSDTGMIGLNYSAAPPGPQSIGVRR